MPSIYDHDIFRMKVGDEEFQIQLLHEFGRNSGRLDKSKIQELWLRYSQHDVLFSDYTQGKLEPFLDAIMDGGSVWWEILRTRDLEPVGLAMLDRVNGPDAYGHFTVWSGRARELIPVFRELMHIAFDRYNLERMSAEVPAYQAGVLRWVRKLGFYQEGEKRRAVKYKDKWFPFLLFGILKEELNDG